MQALLYLIDTEDDLRRAIAVCSTKKLKIVHRKYHRILRPTLQPSQRKRS
jgi:hypothetical protein